MRKVMTVTESRQVTIAVCDFCGSGGAGCGTLRMCRACHRDMCLNCGRLHDYSPWTGQTADNYPDPICNKCSSLMYPYSDQAQELRNEVDEKTSKLRDQWLKLCKENATKPE